MQFADFKHQKEISDILRFNNPIAKVLSKLNPLVPEAALTIQHPHSFVRGPNGKFVEVSFQQLRGEGSEVSRAQLSTRQSDATDISLATVNNVDATDLSSERALLQKHTRRHMIELNRKLHSEITQSQRRLSFVRNGMMDPFGNHERRLLPPIAESKKPISQSNATMGTLGEAIEAHATVDNATAPPVLRSRKSFFFTEPIDWTSNQVDSDVGTSDEVVGAVMTISNAHDCVGAPVTGSAPTSPHLLSNSSFAPNNMSFSSDDAPRMAELAEAMLQRQRDDFYRFPDLQAGMVLSREHQSLVLPPEPQSLKAAEIAKNVAVAAARGLATTRGSEAEFKKRIAEVRSTPIPSGEKHIAVLNVAHQSSDLFFESCAASLSRRKAEQKTKYHKKFKALNLDSDLPFRASASAVLHHVERLIVKEERASSRRDAHTKVVVLFEEIEAYCLNHFSNPQATQLVHNTRRLIVDEDIIPAKEMYLPRVVLTVAPQMFLIDEVMTTAVHLAEVFVTSRREAIDLIRQHAEAFIVNRCDALSSTLQDDTAGDDGDE